MDDRTIATHCPPDQVEAGNRRSGPRYALTLAITMHGDNNLYRGISENLSEGGIFISTHQELATGTVIRLTFSLPTSETPIAVVGEVRWRRSPNAIAKDSNIFGASTDEELKPGLGIRFRELAACDHAAIREFLALRAPEFYDD